MNDSEYNNTIINTIIFIIVLLAKNSLIVIILFQLNKMKETLKVLNLKFVIVSEYLSTKLFLAKVALKIGQKKYLLLATIGSFYD